MLQYKNKNGDTIERYEDDCDEGDLFFNDKKVGIFTIEHDSKLGSYYHITLNNGKQFHDHYFDDYDLVCEIDKIK
jgi:hypothetical protein